MSKKKNIKNNNKVFPKWGWVALGIIILAIVGVIVAPNIFNSSTHLPSEVSVAQAAKLRDKGALILDVREQNEWDQFHIPGATLIPLGELSNRLNEIPKDKTVVVVCRTGHRSAQGRDLLISAGFTQVTSMTGGVTEWQAQGLETVTGPK